MKKKNIGILVLLLSSVTPVSGQIKQITGGSYQFPDGTPCSRCTLTLQLVTDAVVVSTGQIIRRSNTLNYVLDANGNVPANSNLWGNDQLQPNGTTYVATLALPGGGQIWGPEYLSIRGASPINLAQLIPVANPAVYFSNPAVTNLANTFTALQTMPLPLNLTQGGFTNSLTGTVTGARTWTLQDASDTFVFRGTPDTLSNKTLDISLNTLKTATNTAGHYPRNNGTQYVDNTIQAADVPVFVASGASHAPGAVPDPGASAGTTHFLREDATWATVPAGGVSEATLTLQAAGLLGTTGTCGATGSFVFCNDYIFANAHTLTRFVAQVIVAPVGCSTNAVLGIRDITASSNLTTLTPTTTGVSDSGALSIAMTAGHTFGIGLVTTPSGCSTFINVGLTAVFQ